MAFITANLLLLVYYGGRRTGVCQEGCQEGRFLPTRVDTRTEDRGTVTTVRQDGGTVPPVRPNTTTRVHSRQKNRPNGIKLGLAASGNRHCEAPKGLWQSVPLPLKQHEPGQDGGTDRHDQSADWSRDDGKGRGLALNLMPLEPTPLTVPFDTSLIRWRGAIPAAPL